MESRDTAQAIPNHPSDWTEVRKRLFDLTLLVLAAPAWMLLLGVLMVLVRWCDGRPVFFFQIRAGRDGTPFKIFKLRTMTQDLHPADRRPTRLGNVLRWRGLDEVPQVLNVLRGDMSLVGPRPLGLDDAKRLAAEHPLFPRRFDVLPGITGLAQVCLARGAALTAQLDTEYAANPSVVQDVAILIRTLWMNLVGKKRGARSIPAMSEKKVDDQEEARSEAVLVMDTVRSLLAPQRAIPILLVCIPLLVAQHNMSSPNGALALGMAMCVAFVLLAPVSWRVLFPEGLHGTAGLVRLMLYAVIGAGTVLTIGVAIPKLLGMGVTLMTDRVTLAICLALFLVGGWGLGRDIGFEESLARERARTAAMTREAERAQLLAIRAHLDPHFLFNTLNCIAEWCREDGEVAEKAVLQLSSLLRSVLAGVQASSWPLAREMELVDGLLSLHRLRDPGRFDVHMEVDQDMMQVNIPPLVLLPVVENAVKHGPAAGNRGTITIRVSKSDEHVRVHLENPGRYKGPREGSSGLPMVQRRLALAYAGHAHLTINGRDGTTAVEVLLPAKGPEGGLNT